MIKKSSIFLFFIDFIMSMSAMRLMEAVESYKDLISAHGSDTLVSLYPVMKSGLIVIAFVFLALSGYTLVKIISQYRQNSKLYRAANQGDFRG